MTKVKISYTDKDALRKVLEALQPYTIRVKKPAGYSGAFKRAYVDLNL